MVNFGKKSVFDNTFRVHNVAHNPTKFMPGKYREKAGNIMKTMSIYAQALTFNRDFAKNQINAKTIGFAEYCTWKQAIFAVLVEAYKVEEYRHNHMGDAEEVKRCDMNGLYDALRPVIKLIGEVNGDTLNPANIAEAIPSGAMRLVKIDISPEMAHARCEYLKAKKNHDNAEQGKMSDAEFIAELSRLDKIKNDAKAEVDRLEALPGNCKLDPDMQTESAFAKFIHAKLGDAILKQKARPTESVLADKAKREADRKAKRKANKQAKKSAK